MVAKIGYFTRIILTPFQGLLRELDRMHDKVDRHDREIQELRAEVERLTRENEVLRGQNQALTERQRELDAALDPVRHQITAQRGLPNERTFEHLTLASRYVQFVEHDITDLANVGLRIESASTHARGNRSDGTEQAAQTEPRDALVRREAELARKLTLALLGGETPDEAQVRKLVGSALSRMEEKQVDHALAEATALHHEMAAHGATFDERVKAGASSRGTRPWLNCEPGGAVEFVVAPAYLANGKLIADQTGKPAGPWVFTSVTGPAE